MVHYVDQTKGCRIEKEDDVIGLVALLTRLTFEQVKKYHPRVVELDEICHIYEPASKDVPEITELIKKTIGDLLEKWRHAEEKKFLLKAFSKHGTAWHCKCNECNKDTNVYD